MVRLQENILQNRLNLTRATLRPDLAILTMAGFLDARPRVGYFYTGKSGTQLLTENLQKILCERLSINSCRGE